MLATQFGLLVLVSLLHAALDCPGSARSTRGFTRRSARKTKCAGMILPMTCPRRPQSGLMDGAISTTVSRRDLPTVDCNELGLEIPRLSWFDWGGFLAAWVLVGGLIGLLIWLAGFGSR